MLPISYDFALFRARRTPDKEAVIDWHAGVRYTWRDIDERSARVATLFVDVFHLSAGDRVGIFADSCMGIIDLFFAAVRTGVVLVPYNARLKATELAEMMEMEELSLLLYSDDWAEKAFESVRLLGRQPLMFRMGQKTRGCDSRGLADIANDVTVPMFGQAEVDWESPFMFVHTGGTTGLPKAAVLSRRAVVLNAFSEILVWNLGEDDLVYLSMPFCHTSGWSCFSFPLLIAGGRVIVGGRFSADDFFEITAKERPTMFLGADAMYKEIESHADFDALDLSCFKWVIGGGAPVSLSTMKRFWAKGVKFFVGYGSSETGANGLCPDVSISLEENMMKPQTVGKPMAFTEMKIVDRSGSEVAQGVEGELLLRCDYAFSEYWRRPEETKSILENGWIHTGDIAYQDKDGDVYISGRIKTMYISAGENVFPVEVERCIDSFPSVIESCVFGVPDARWGEVGKALVVAGDGFCLDGLRQHLERHLATIKRPKYIQVVPEIPHNDAGKRDEKEIRRCYGAV